MLKMYFRLGLRSLFNDYFLRRGAPCVRPEIVGQTSCFASISANSKRLGRSFAGQASLPLRRIKTLYKFLGWLIIILATTLCLLRFGMPFLMPTIPQLAQRVEKEIGFPMQVQKIELSWEGIQPVLTLSEVEVFSLEHKPALHIAKMQMVLNTAELLLGRFRVDDLVIQGVTLGIEYHQNRKISIAGLPSFQIDLEELLSREGRSFRRLFITHSDIHIMLDDGRSYPLANTNVVVEHKNPIRLHATTTLLGKEKAIPIELGAIAGAHHDDWHVNITDLQIDQSESMHGFIANKACDNARCWEFKTDHINIEKIQKEIEQIFVFPENLAKILKDYQPKGQLDYVHFGLKQTEGKFLPSSVNLVFTNMQFAPTDKTPGVSSISGALVFDGTKGKINLQSDTLQLQYPGMFTAPITIDDMALVLGWQKNNEGAQLKMYSLKGSFCDAAMGGQGNLQFSADKKLPTIDMVLHLDRIKIKDALSAFPRNIMDKSLVTWLDSALQTGELLSSDMVIRGDLNDFPFNQQEGIFEVYSELENVTLDYTKGWPKLTDLKANLLIRNRALYIFAKGAKLIGGNLLDADAVIPDLGANIPQLIVDADISSTLQYGTEVIQNSPLKDTLGRELKPFDLQGNMSLSLGLEVPITTKEADIKVRGLITVQDANVNVPEWDLGLTTLEGEVTFTQDSVHSQKLTAAFLGEPLLLSLNSTTDQESQLHIAASGKMDAQKLNNWLKIEKNNVIQGNLDYEANVIISANNHDQTNLTLTSNLNGIAIHAPPPFNKAALDPRPSEIKISFDPNQLMRVWAKYGDEINLAFSLSKQSTWHPMGGHIHFGQKRLAKFREDGVLLVDGDIGLLDVGEWQAWLPKSQPKNLLEPLVELNIDKLNLYGIAFANTKIEAQWSAANPLWNINFDGPSLKGHVVLPQGEDLRDISIDLEKLMIDKNHELASVSTTTLKELPRHRSIDIKIKEFILDKINISNIQGRLTPSWKGYFSPDVKANLQAATVNLSGNWDYLGIDQIVAVQGKINTRNISDTLQSLGITSSLKKAKGTMGFSLQWNGMPMKVDYASLGGQADFTLQKGVIHGVNPGIGRVLSLLNIDNVHRRLNLDFSDVTKGGFAFDEITGKFQFAKGKVITNKITLNGPSAKMEANGSAELENQGLNGELIVMPNVTGSLPVAAAIAAGNPAVGAAVWVADKMFGNKIQEIHRIRYKVLGTWQSPRIEELRREKWRT